MLNGGMPDCWFGCQDGLPNHGFSGLCRPSPLGSCGPGMGPAPESQGGGAAGGKIGHELAIPEFHALELYIRVGWLGGGQVGTGAGWLPVEAPQAAPAAGPPAHGGTSGGAGGTCNCG